MKLPGTRKILLTGGAMAITLMASTAWARDRPTPPAPMPAGANGPQADFPVTVGAPYQIGGSTFVPSDSMNFDSVGYASVGTEGGNGISAAHHTLPVPSYAEVTDIKTGRTILIRIDRRGPMDNTHAIELSPGAATQLGLAPGSNAGVRVRRVNPPEAERALLRAGNPAPERMATPKPLLDVLQRKLNPGLAQRALDNGDDDTPATAAAPIRLASGTKPAAVSKSAPPKLTAAPMTPPVTAKALPATPKPVESSPAVASGISAPPPKGYVPSVPAPVAKPAAITAVNKGKPVPAAPVTVKAKPPVAPAKPEPVKKPDATKKADAAETPHDAKASAGSMTVQAGAFSDKARAQAVADKIGGSLMQAGAVWRVRVGPYATHASAEAALAKVKSAGYSDARIQRGQ